MAMANLIQTTDILDFLQVDKGEIQNEKLRQ